MGYERKWNDDKDDEELHPLVLIGVAVFLLLAALLIIGF
jgi:hypothetical protein